MRLNKTFREFRDFADDHHMTMPLSVAAGALKGAIVGLAIGKLALATAAGIAGGAAVGAAVSWRNQHRKRVTARTDAGVPR